MQGKHVLGLVLALGLLITAGSALAWGPGHWGGFGWGGGGHCWRAGGSGPAWDEDTSKLHDDLYQKQTEMRNLISADEIDEGKVKALQAEINKLRDELSQKRLSAILDYRKQNKDWRPGYCPGYGRRDGYGPGYGRRDGWGPGGCWR